MTSMQRCEAMIKRLIVEYSLEKIFISWNCKENGYIGYRFVVGNQKRWVLVSDKLQNMGLFVEFKQQG